MFYIINLLQTKWNYETLIINHLIVGCNNHEQRQRQNWILDIFMR